MNTSKLAEGCKSGLARLWTMLHHGLALVGLVAIMALVSQAGHLFPSGSNGDSESFGTIRYEDVSLFDVVDESENPRYRALATYLSRRYKVASDATERLVGAAYEAGQRIGLDPLLILAVMAIESRLNPIAESVVGAKGLMQVVPKHHHDKLEEHGGADSVLDPMTNILVGARILKEYIRRTGSIEAGLQTYAGALSDSSSQYSQKVFAEKERLEQTIRRSKRVGAET
jgi:energy-converting hydrogenase Eha subunit A